MQAEQFQSGENVEKVEADQEQGLTVDYSQSLNVDYEEEQHQETLVKVEQNQSFHTNHHTDSVEQSMETELKTHQKDEFYLEEKQNKNNQTTNVNSSLEHQSETSGDAIITQKQSVETLANTRETDVEIVKIKAIAENGIEMVKKASHYVVKIFQLIVINDVEIDRYEDEYTFEQHFPVQKSQEYRKEYDWGILSIFNHAAVHPTLDNDLHTNLSSIVKLHYFIEQNNHEKTDEDETGNEEPAVPEEDDQREDNSSHPYEDEQEDSKEPSKDPLNEEITAEKDALKEEEDKSTNSRSSTKKVLEDNPKNHFLPLGHAGKTNHPTSKHKFDQKNLIHSFIDHDNDGVPNHLEVNKFKTDPFKSDTDDDGLSDEFEIKYHSATSFYYTFECMEYDWRDFVLTTDLATEEDEDVEEWKKIRLSPLINDRDQNGIIDHLEDFDGDGISNLEEQIKGSNPYIHNENKSYVGPTGAELLKIMEEAQKGC